MAAFWLHIAWIVSTLVIVGSSSPSDHNYYLCERTYFYHGKEDAMPYVQLEGVYVAVKGINSTRPVYKHEVKDYFFEYNSTSNHMYFSQLDNGKRSYMGVKAEMNSRFRQSDWYTFEIPGSPFMNSTKRWLYYDQGGNTDREVSTQNIKIHFTCVPTFFQRCSSERLWFITGKNGVIVTNGSFSPLPDTFKNNRRVYQHSRKNWFLFYQSAGYWAIGTDHLTPEPANDTFIFKAFDSPIHPEFIISFWKVRGEDGGYDNFSAGLRCKGIPPRRRSNGTMIGCRDSNPCLHGTKCVDNPLIRYGINGTSCRCPYHLKGPTCSQQGLSCSTSTLSLAPDEHHYTRYNLTAVGDVVTVFRKSTGIQSFYFKQCQSSGTRIFWNPPGDPEKLPHSGFNFDDYKWSVPVFLAGFPLLHILIPLLHVIMCGSQGKSILRILSMHAWVSFYLWITYYVVYTCADLADYGKVLEHLKLMAFAMIGVSYIFMLIESFFAAERNAISNSLGYQSAIEYIIFLAALTPRRVMSIECWHIEACKKMAVTNTEEADFPIGYCRDVSNSTDIFGHGVTRLQLSHNVECGDEETAGSFEAMKEDMLARNKAIDTNITFKSLDETEGLPKELYVFSDVKPCWMNPCCFWLATILGLGWPFRWLFGCTAKKGHYEMKKHIFLRSPGSEDGPQSTPAQKVPCESKDGIGLVNMAYANSAPRTASNVQNSAESTVTTPAKPASTKTDEMLFATLPGQPIVTSAKPPSAAPDTLPS